MLDKNHGIHTTTILRIFKEKVKFYEDMVDDSNTYVRLKKKIPVCILIGNGIPPKSIQHVLQYTQPHDILLDNSDREAFLSFIRVVLLSFSA